MSDNVHVAIRVRPLIARELKDQDDVHWSVGGQDTIYQTSAPSVSYNFDRVFDAREANDKVFFELCSPIVQSVMQGFNGTIFAYGQTSSGKTYTMMGEDTSKLSMDFEQNDNAGIIPNTVHEIFNTIENMPDREFLLRVSYMEIYNEMVSDLLSDSSENLKVQEDKYGNVTVNGLQEKIIKKPVEIFQLMKIGEKKRRVGETRMNQRSSRSHTIFRIIIESLVRNTDEDVAINVSQFNLIDLAGSERAGQTGATGDRFKEGVHINKSLSMLGHVISQLSERESGQFVNYRDSKLTRILQNSLGGNARTVIICTVTPASLEQTHSTLKFASRAKRIKNKPQINEILTEQALSRQYANKIKKLTEELETSKGQGKEWVEGHEKLKQQIEENEKLKQQIEELKEKFIVSQLPPVLNFQNRKVRRETWGGILDKRGAKLFFPPKRDFFVIPENFETLQEEPNLEFDIPDSSIRISLGDFNSTVNHVSNQISLMIERTKDQEIQTDNLGISTSAECPPKLTKRIETLSSVIRQLKRDYKELEEFTTYEKQFMVTENKSTDLSSLCSCNLKKPDPISSPNRSNDKEIQVTMQSEEPHNNKIVRNVPSVSSRKKRKTYFDFSPIQTSILEDSTDSDNIKSITKTINLDVSHSEYAVSHNMDASFENNANRENSLGILTENHITQFEGDFSVFSPICDSEYKSSINNTINVLIDWLHQASSVLHKVNSCGKDLASLNDENRIFSETITNLVKPVLVSEKRLNATSKELKFLTDQLLNNCTLLTNNLTEKDQECDILDKQLKKQHNVILETENKLNALNESLSDCPLVLSLVRSQVDKLKNMIASDQSFDLEEVLGINNSVLSDTKDILESSDSKNALESCDSKDALESCDSKDALESCESKDALKSFLCKDNIEMHPLKAQQTMVTNIVDSVVANPTFPTKTEFDSIIAALHTQFEKEKSDLKSSYDGVINALKSQIEIRTQNQEDLQSEFEYYKHCNMEEQISCHNVECGVNTDICNSKQKKEHVEGIYNLSRGTEVQNFNGEYSATFDELKAQYEQEKQDLIHHFEQKIISLQSSIEHAGNDLIKSQEFQHSTFIPQKDLLCSENDSTETNKMAGIHKVSESEQCSISSNENWLNLSQFERYSRNTESEDLYRELENKVTEKEKEHATMNCEIDLLKKELSSKFETEKAVLVANFNSEIKSVMLEKEAAIAELVSELGQLQAIATENARIKSELDEYDAKTLDLVSSYGHKINRLQSEIDTGIKENEDLLNELNNLKNSSDRKSIELKTTNVQIDFLKKELSDKFETEKAALVENFDSNLDSLKSEKEELTAENNRLQTLATENINLKSNHQAEISNLILHYEDQISSLQSELDTRNKENVDLLKAINNLKNIVNEKESFIVNNEVEYLEKKLRNQFELEKVTLISNFKSEIDTLKTKHDDLTEKLTSEHNQLIATITEKNVLQSDLQKQFEVEKEDLISSYDHDISLLQSKIDASTKENEILLVELNDLKNSINEKEKMLISVSELDLLKKELGDRFELEKAELVLNFRNEIDSLKSETENVTERLSVVHNQFQAAVTEKSDLISSYDYQISLLQSKIESTTKENEIFLKELDSITNNANEKENLLNASNKIDLIKKELNDQYESEKATLVSDFKNVIDSLKSENKHLTENLSTERNQFQVIIDSLKSENGNLTKSLSLEHNQLQATVAEKSDLISSYEQQISLLQCKIDECTKENESLLEELSCMKTNANENEKMLITAKNRIDLIKKELNDQFESDKVTFVSDFNNVIDSLKSENKHLTESLSTERNQFQVIIDSLKSENGNLTKSLSLEHNQLQATVAEKSDLISSYEQQISLLQCKIDECTKENESLLEELSCMKTNANENEKMLITAKNKIDLIKKELNDQYESEKATFVFDFNNVIDSLKSENKHLTESLSTERNQFQSIVKGKSDLISSYDHQITLLQSKIDASTKEIKNLLEELSNIKNNCNKNEKIFNTTRNEVVLKNELCDQFESEKALLVSEFKNEIDSLKLENANLAQKFATTYDQLEGTATEKVTFQSAFDLQKHFEAEKDTLVSFYEDKINLLESKIDANTAECAILLKQSNNFKNNINEKEQLLITANNKIALIKKELGDQFELEKLELISKFRNEIDSLKSEKDNLTAKITEYNQLQIASENSNLQPNLQNPFETKKSDLVSSYELKINSLELEISKGNEERQTLLNELHCLRSSIHSKENEHANSEKTLVLENCECSNVMELNNRDDLIKKELKDSFENERIILPSNFEPETKSENNKAIEQLSTEPVQSDVFDIKSQFEAEKTNLISSYELKISSLQSHVTLCVKENEDLLKELNCLKTQAAPLYEQINQTIKKELDENINEIVNGSNNYQSSDSQNYCTFIDAHQNDIKTKSNSERGESALTHCFESQPTKQFQDIIHLKGKIEHFESENDNLKKRYSNLVEELNDLECKIMEECQYQLLKWKLPAQQSIYFGHNPHNALSEHINVLSNRVNESGNYGDKISQVEEKSKNQDSNLEGTVTRKIKNALSVLIQKFNSEKSCTIELYEEEIKLLKFRLETAESDLDKYSSLFSPKLRELKSNWKKEVIKSMEGERNAEFSEELEAKIFELQKAHKREIQDTIGHYQEKIDDLEVKYSQTIREKQELETSNKGLKTKLRNEVEEKTCSIKAYERKISDFEESLHACKTYAKDIHKSNRHLKLELKSKDNQISSLKSKLDKQLSEDFHHLIKKKTLQIENLEKEKVESESKIRIFHDNISSLLSKQRDLENQISRLEGDIKLKDQTVNEMVVKVHKLSTDLDMKNAKIQSLSLNNERFIEESNRRKCEIKKIENRELKKVFFPTTKVEQKSSQHKSTHGMAEVAEANTQETGLTPLEAEKQKLILKLQNEIDKLKSKLAINEEKLKETQTKLKESGKDRVPSYAELIGSSGPAISAQVFHLQGMMEKREKEIIKLRKQIYKSHENEGKKSQDCDQATVEVNPPNMELEEKENSLPQQDSQDVPGAPKKRTKLLSSQNSELLKNFLQDLGNGPENAKKNELKPDIFKKRQDDHNNPERCNQQ